MTPPLLTMHDVQRLLRLSPRKIYELTQPTCPQPIPHLRIGRRVLFIEADVWEWVRRRQPEWTKPQ